MPSTVSTIRVLATIGGVGLGAKEIANQKLSDGRCRPEVASMVPTSRAAGGCGLSPFREGRGSSHGLLAGVSEAAATSLAVYLGRPEKRL